MKRGKKKVLSNNVSSSGYAQVNLYVSGMCTHFSVHQLVALVFIGVCPEGYTVNHKDGNKLNNHWTNLEYVSYSSNTLHALNNGICFNRGETHYNSVLTEKSVRDIRRRVANGESWMSVANSYGVCKSTVGCVVRGKSWSHVR